MDHAFEFILNQSFSSMLQMCGIYIIQFNQEHYFQVIFWYFMLELQTSHSNEHCSDRWQCSDITLTYVAFPVSLSSMSPSCVAESNGRIAWLKFLYQVAEIPVISCF